MSDYISRKALIGKVEKHYCAPCKGQDGDLGGDWCRACVIHSVLGKIRGIPAADVQTVRRWIPFSERLPESCSVNGETVSCLVYVPSFGAVDIADYHPDVDEWTFMGLPVTITHWMPLPEPPEEGEPSNG